MINLSRPDVRSGDEARFNPVAYICRHAPTWNGSSAHMPFFMSIQQLLMKGSDRTHSVAPEAIIGCVHDKLVLVWSSIGINSAQLITSYTHLHTSSSGSRMLAAGIMTSDWGRHNNKHLAH